MTLDLLYLSFCYECHLATIREHPENKKLIKCAYCGYTTTPDQHKERLINRLEKERGEK